MDMFILNEEIARREAQLPLLSGDACIEGWTQLSWHLRQRDMPRALSLAVQAKTLLASCTLPELEKNRITARLHLVEGEAKWLLADLPGAKELALKALDEFSAQDGDEDGCGCADAHWLLAWLAIDSGDLSESDAQFEACATAAQRAHDPVRDKIAEAALARWAVLRNPQAAKERWNARFKADADDLHPAVFSWREDFFGMLMHFTGDIGLSVTHTINAHELALETGQIRAAIICATNISEDFDRLNDHQLALAWTQRALDLARPTNWPRSVGACLMHMGENQRNIGNLDAAQDMLNEAMEMLKPVANSRPYALALQYQSNLALDRRDYAVALDAFIHLEKKAHDLQQNNFFIDAKRGQAHALSHLGKPEQALTIAQAALAAAEEKGDGSRQIEVLAVLADIHIHHPQIAAPAAVNGSAPLHYLNQVLETAKSISGYTISGKILETLGREYAKAGLYEQAYAVAMQAITVREKTHSQDVTNRAIAMQVTHQTEQARTTSEYHRQLAAAEAQRAEVLMQTGLTLKQLSTIGREITAHLDAAAVFDVLNRHMHGLLDVNSFAIYLLEPEARRLVMTYSIEGDKPLPIDYVDLADPDSNSARCLREKRDLLCHLNGDNDVSFIPETLLTLTALFSPLTVGERQIGVITIQSLKPNAYTDRDRLIFGTLSAYAAIAINNALTYQELQETQKKLLAQEKMAALGSLVAGIAHELNTPISNSILLSSTMSHKTGLINEKLIANQMRRSELTQYIKESTDAFTLNLRSLQSAAELVDSFKQIAVDRTTAQRRVFDVRQLMQDILATMMNQLQKLGLTVTLDAAEDIRMESYPGPLGQVLMNLINNALRHAFEGRAGGHILLSAKRTSEDRMQIQFSDNGIGIPADNLLKIFNPFFTTKLGQGGSGLGLSISYNIVTSILNGHIQAQSEPGSGTTFTLDLPLLAPA